MKTGTVYNIQKFCLHDGDGIRTCVFLKGCTLRCIWCHNPESFEKKPCISFDKQKCSSCGRCTVCAARFIDNGVLNIDRKKCLNCNKCIRICHNEANKIIGKEMTSAQVFDEVIKDKMFYDVTGGLTVTGGEPSCQAEFTLELLTITKDAGINIAVETCGTGTRSFYKQAADLGATFLYDIKCMEPMRHRELTGADNTDIISNLCYLMDRNADIIIRLPLIPECNDSDGDIAHLAAFLNENKGRYRYAEIMPYHSLGAGKYEKTGTIASYVHAGATDAEISRWCAQFAFHGTDVRVSK